MATNSTPKKKAVGPNRAQKRTAQRAVKKAVTKASEWKSGVKSEIDLEVPSGNVCRVKAAVGMGAFFAGGKIPNALMPMVTEALEGKKPSSEELKGLIDAEGLAAILSLANDVCLEAVVEPKLHRSEYTDMDAVHHVIPEGLSVGDTIPDEERDEDLLYVDEVDFEDRMFIFAHAVGSGKSVESFRQGSEEVVADISAIGGVE